MREPRDFYPTPLSAFTPMLEYIPKDAIIWEPAYGDYRLVKCLEDNGYIVGGGDLVNGYDFLKDTVKKDTIVTNPPYSKVFEFVKHSYKLAYHTYMLLRLGFLGSQHRAEWLKDHRPSAIFILGKRPSFVKGRTDNSEYAWMYWANDATMERHNKGIFFI